jgi:hypothetical protein
MIYKSKDRQYNGQNKQYHVNVCHYIVCPSICRSYLILFMFAIILSVLRFVDHIWYCLFWPLYCLSFDLPFSTTPLVFSKIFLCQIQINFMSNYERHLSHNYTNMVRVQVMVGVVENGKSKDRQYNGQNKQYQIWSTNRRTDNIMANINNIKYDLQIDGQTI